MAKGTGKTKAEWDELTPYVLKVITEEIEKQDGTQREACERAATRLNNEGKTNSRNEPFEGPSLDTWFGREKKRKAATIPASDQKKGNTEVTDGGHVTKPDSETGNELPPNDQAAADLSLQKEKGNEEVTEETGVTKADDEAGNRIPEVDQPAQAAVTQKIPTDDQLREQLGKWLVDEYQKGVIGKMIAVFQEHGTTTPLQAQPATDSVRPVFVYESEKTKQNTGIRCHAGILKAAVDKAATEKRRTGGSLSQLVELLLWQYIGSPPEFCEGYEPPAQTPPPDDPDTDAEPPADKIPPDTGADDSENGG